jgi:hypothetical protein
MRIATEQTADKDELDHRKRLGIAPNSWNRRSDVTSLPLSTLPHLLGVSRGMVESAFLGLPKFLAPSLIDM